jgi:hypothetical protein
MRLQGPGENGVTTPIPAFSVVARLRLRVV